MALLRVGGVMQGLAQKREVDARGGNRWFFDFAEPVLEILEAVLFGQAGTELDHFFRVVDGDDLLGTSSEELGEGAFAGAQIGDDDGRHEGKEHVGDAVPGAAGAIGAAKFPGELIEVLAGAVVPLFERNLESGQVAGGFGQFLGRGLHDRVQFGVFPIVDQHVVDVLSRTAITDEPGLAKLREVAGNPRLAHTEDLLDFDDGELFLLEKEEETQARFVGEKAQGFYD